MMVLGVIGGTGMLVMPKEREKEGRKIGLWIGLIIYSVSVLEWIIYRRVDGRELVENSLIGIDEVSINFIMLTTSLTVMCILGVWKKEGVMRSIGLYLIMESLMLGVFMIKDMVYFYICYEGVLIPMYLIIGSYGSRERRIKAGIYLFMYTLLGSVFMLLGILIVYMETGGTEYEVIYYRGISERKEKVLWLLFMIGFMVKIPMIPVHIWLPEAHVEAPTEGSVILAGVLLKLGGYGMIRYSLGVLPEGSEYFKELVSVIGMIGVVYTALTAARQTDMKRVIAYASIGHMSMIVIGLFSMVEEGYRGGIYQMISHGIVSGGLFFCVGVLYDRYHSRTVWYYSGMIRLMPVFGIVWFVLVCSNIGIPGTASFVGEIMLISGIFEMNKYVGVISGTSMILGAVYTLWLYNRVMFGNIKSGVLKEIRKRGMEVEISRRESAIMMPLAIITVMLGVSPGIVLDVYN